ncbi:MAG: DUF4380 domain-containing protein [Bacteroidales bacterium]|nr:DUF4380 domain-containing protein [Bacteroidales bacterium]
MDEIKTFKLHEVLLTIDPNDGAKDISLNAYGVELLTGKEVRKEYYGSSLWLSPQGKFWPEPDALDYGPYEVSEVEGGILFTSEPDNMHGFQYFKEIRLDYERNAFIHTYKIKNISDSVQSCAAWEVTRLPKKGLSLFPLSEYGIDKKQTIDTSITTLEKDGLMWHSYDTSQLGHPGKHCKTFAFGSEGWLAYVLEDVLLIKQFPNVSPEHIAEGESDIEIYVCPQFNYIELESQGPYTSLEPGEDLGYTVTWYLKKLPEKIEKKPGSNELIKLVRETIN